MQETQETQVRSLEEGMATHSSILAWRINPMDGGAWQATVRGGHMKLYMTEVTEHAHAC